MSVLKNRDPKVYKAIYKETERQAENLELKLLRLKIKKRMVSSGTVKQQNYLVN